MKKGYLDFSFSTIFAILAGIFILGLAIYGAIRFMGLGQNVTNIQVSKEIGILLNPLEIGYEKSKVNSLSLGVESRIYNGCDNKGNFGRQALKISQKSFNEWVKTDVNVYFENKYLFSKNPVEGKEFYIFSKPFELPFKVADLTYITSYKESYCFKDVPYTIKEELSFLKQGNIFVDKCLDNQIIVCFSERDDCDIRVYYDEGYIKKNKKVIYFYGDALMYAGIFSDNSIYECQLKRLMKKIGILAEIYIDKANFISSKECNSNLNSDLLSLINLCNNFEDSSNLNSVAKISEEIMNKNKLAQCKLW